MSSVDPRWPAPDESAGFAAPAPRSVPPPHHTSQSAYTLAGVMAVVIVLLIAAHAGAYWALREVRGTRIGDIVPGGSAGKPGLGDPYYPNAGNSGYDVTKYRIEVNWEPATETLTGTTTIEAIAGEDLTSFYYDLALTTESVNVDGTEAAFAPEGFSDVKVTPRQKIAAGATFTTVVRYAGKPGDRSQGDVHPWWRTQQEWTAAGEPESSTWWFPGNDHPSDPALMDISVRVPAGMEAISVGRLESSDSADERDFDTWHWVARQPMASFLSMVSIGQYEVRQGVDQGLPYLYAVSEQLPEAQRRRAFAALETSTSRIRTLEQRFGPYPFTEAGGVVPAHRLWFAGLETQTRPVYDAGAISDDGFADRLITHELAHMWFGDNVTVREWNDIFISEAYASWAEWAVDEGAGRIAANRRLDQTFAEVRDNPRFWRVSMIDPGREHLFDAVYTRGPMTLQALRNVMGDDAFARLSRDWAQSPGARSLEEWMSAAQQASTVDLTSFFQVWIFGTSAPDRTADNGFR